MGKFYEDLETLNELIKKIDKKNQLSEFIVRALRIMKENPNKSISDVIKETKKKFD
jgi:predicted hydrocarbon binding protein